MFECSGKGRLHLWKVQRAYPRRAQVKSTESQESGCFQGIFRVFFAYALSGYALGTLPTLTKKLSRVASEATAEPPIQLLYFWSRKHHTHTTLTLRELLVQLHACQVL